jgi:hypothetical protein
MKTQSLVCPIVVNSSLADSQPVHYARVSIPVAKGKLKGTPAVVIQAPDGRRVPVQSELLARWPDQSVRVVHATFPAKAGVYQALFEQKAGRVAAERGGIKIVRKGKNRVVVTNGRLTARLGGEGLVESISLGGRTMIGPRGVEVRVMGDQRRPFTATACRDVKTEVELAGPLRSIVTLRGKCTLEKETFLNFRLRFEFLAGVEGFSLAYAFHNLERGQDFFDTHGIELELHLADATNPQHTVYQQSYGLFSTLGRVVTTPRSFDIRVDDSKALAYVHNYEALGDEHDYPFYLNPPCDKVDNWAVVSDEGRALFVDMDDFHLMRPKSLNLEGNVARFGIWPGWAGKLDLQQGKSRQVTVRVGLSDKGPPTTQHAGVVQGIQLRDAWRAQLPHPVYAEARFFDQGRVLPCRPIENPRFESWLTIMSSGLNSVATFFDLGDTPDSGYQTTYLPVGGRIRHVRGPEQGPRYYSTSLHFPMTRQNTMSDFEPVWVNNEYDVIHCMATECLRTGDRSVFQKLCWFARHGIDVDFLHYSDHHWLNRATPAHSERHTSTGAYPSHFWTQGLTQYYLLTADPDALEVIVALAEKTIENLEDPTMKEVCSGLNREIGWGILTMICAYEASGIKKFDAYARRLLDREINYGLPADLPVFSFGHTSILLGTREYLQIHEGEKAAEPVRKWFLEFVDLAIRSSRGAPKTIVKQEAKEGTQAMSFLSYDMGWLQGGGLRGSLRSGIFNTHSMALDPLAYAYEITGNKRYIEAGMRSIEALMDSQAFSNPVPEGKPYAMVYRTFVNFLKAASELGYLKTYGYKH